MHNYLQRCYEVGITEEERLLTKEDLVERGEGKGQQLLEHLFALYQEFEKKFSFLPPTQEQKRLFFDKDVFASISSKMTMTYRSRERTKKTPAPSHLTAVASPTAGAKNVRSQRGVEILTQVLNVVCTRGITVRCSSQRRADNN